MKFAAAIDHLVVAAADLESGSAWLEEKLGAKLAPGGKHAAMGTHNRLLQLGPKRYLELIAIDPAAPGPGRPRWFSLDSAALRKRIAERPRLIHWVARCDDIAAASAACPEPPGEILELSRDGLSWRITVPPDGHLPGDGLLPSLIQWRTPAHPADSLPERGCALMKLEGFHPDPARLRRTLAALGLGDSLAVYAMDAQDGTCPADAGDEPGLIAYLRTPAGLREID